MSGETHPNFGDSEGYLRELCELFGLHLKKIKETRGWSIGHSSWRLDLLPTQYAETDAFHRRRGIVYGYPSEAIGDFISTTMRITSCDLVRAGFFTAEEVAYLSFVPYTYHNSVERYNELIEIGMANRDRITQIARAWGMAMLDNYADALYTDAVEAYRGKGFALMTMFPPPDDDVTKSDVTRLLAE